MGPTRRMTVLAAAAATAASLIAAAPATSAAPSRPSSPSSPVALRGSAPQVHAARKAETHALSTRSKGVRHRPSSARGLASQPPSVATSTSGAAGTLLHTFNGVSSRDSEVTNFNQRFEPPDQGLCVGNGYVLEPVNSAYSIYRANGTRVRGPFNVNDLFNEGAAEFTSDPRCYYDPATRRWFATILFLNAAFTEGRIDVAVSQTSDPTGLWSQFRIDTTHPGGFGCPCFGDQPRIGIDRNNLYVTTDEYSINGDQFNGAQAYAISKKDLVTDAASAHFVQFTNLRSAGHLAFSVQPAITNGSAAAEYFLSSLDPKGNGDDRIQVWALTHGDRVTNGGTPVLTSKVIASEPYANPQPSAQKGSTTTIDSGDDRMQQTQYINGLVWGELDTAVTRPGNPAPRAGAAWFAVRPTISKGRLSAASVRRQGYVATPRGSLLYPALQADAAGRAAMVFTLTGPNTYPSAAYATLPATGTTFSRVRVAGAGTGPYDKDATRWGDYSFAVKSPTSDAVWMATEYMPPKASQTSTRERNWGTRVFEVGLP